MLEVKHSIDIDCGKTQAKYPKSAVMCEMNAGKGLEKLHVMS